MYEVCNPLIQLAWNAKIDRPKELRLRDFKLACDWFGVQDADFGDQVSLDAAKA